MIPKTEFSREHLLQERPDLSRLRPFGAVKKTAQAMEADLNFEVRLMKSEDIPQVIDIWKETGLAEGTHTVYTWYNVDPEGFFVAANEEGEIYGVCASVILNDDLAFLGLYAVRRNFQKRGIGVKIWQQAMIHVGDRNAGLNSVPEHLHTYRDLAGFRIVSKWQTIVCESKNVDISLLCQSATNLDVETIDEDSLPDVIQYDRSIHGFYRSKTVSLTIKEVNSLVLVAYRQNGAGERYVCGYGCIKENIQGTAMVGPLYADDPLVAEILLYRLVSSFEIARRNGMTIAIIDCNVDALLLIDKLGLNMTTKVPRCYLKEEVDVDFNKVFGHHALNFSTF